MMAMQSAVVQQSLLEMHELVFVQIRSLFGHAQAPPGAGQISPGTGQSPLLQQLLAGMQVPLAMQSLSPAPQAQLPLLHVCIGPHTLPQAPQLFGSLFVLAQYGCVGPPASVAAPPESTKPASEPLASPPLVASSAPVSAPPVASMPVPPSGGRPHSVSPPLHE
jgi:hypothetical protein